MGPEETLYFFFFAAGFLAAAFLAAGFLAAVLAFMIVRPSNVDSGLAEPLVCPTRSQVKCNVVRIISFFKRNFPVTTIENIDRCG